ncbi:putative cytokinetic ring protein SteA [Desulfofalx alkaliphila]|uniref:putative cytokinetic ring protein SteA n=1 Tax=Desulfofalx alkaliphila TaxID=105483 RepID=UPI0004E0C72E|nr:putative cytokinetic ring protein SteA [Desulfofalx alkaliphila]
MHIKGTARLDRRTKNLVKRLQPGDIAVINHHELDKVAAQSLAGVKVKAVINAAPSLSADYPNLGPLTLLDSGIPLIDDVGEDLFELLAEGDKIEIINDEIYHGGKLIAKGKLLDREYVCNVMEQSKKNVNATLYKFVQNTLDYAHNEIDLICKDLPIPKVNVDFNNRHTLIVVRGHNYKEDLAAIKSYIDEVKPVLIGVDGGADALLEFGHQPDIIIGDMDSISNSALKCGAELIVHGYPDGRAPGLERVQNLGLKAQVFAARGTSEDIAMLLAYEKGTDLIVAVGTHSNMLEFLEKGRKGMASTFLVRLKVGSILVDAKGVNKLYKNPLKARYLAQVVLAAMVPLAVVMVIAPPTRELLRLIYIQFRILLGI